uniref:G-protein coupled receptors family 2 profile 2 domain-containing protein n=1 Tax=Oryzias melastigma TaxID=30732 RepID=A0A3B3C050_ORYME
SNQNNLSACSVVTFFIHFFYLALFFWMLALGLLLINSTVNVLSVGPSKAGMLAIGFSLGYGASLVIAAVTVAVTAPPGEYIRDNNVCWLNWDKSKALLAFVIPALLIVLINLIILATVISKLVKSKAGKNTAQDGERHILVVIAKSLAVLTPFLGLTWGLGFGTVSDPKNVGIHAAFAFFNSLQVQIHWLIKVIFFTFYVTILSSFCRMVNLKVIWLVVTFLSPSCCQQNDLSTRSGNKCNMVFVGFFNQVSQNRSSNPAGEPKTFRLSIIETSKIVLLWCVLLKNLSRTMKRETSILKCNL